MKIFKKVVDERQELELMRIERTGFWVLFWGLFIAIQVQLFSHNQAVGEMLRQIAGEGIVLLLGAIVVLIGCVRKGVWSYSLKPNTKTNFIISLAVAVVFSLFSTFRMTVLYGSNLLPISIILAFAVTFASLFAACFILLTFFAFITKKRKENLESAFDENIRDDDH